MKFNIPKYLIDDGYISVTKHPEYDLYIYNYTAKTQYESKWNKHTEICRGLILDSEYNVIARPFKKFFNIEELGKSYIPKKKSFKVYTKMDGSLGILYWINDKPFIATRGSFTSNQANKANEILYKKYSHLFHLLNKNKTYLFEIIYKENRIVVDYGDMEDLVLLAIIDTETGKDLPLENVGFPIVECYDGINDISILKSLEESNKEGFVVKFSTGFRVKVKFDEYKRIHKIVTQVSSKTVWENLKVKLPLTEILDRVPDEFYNWVKITQQKLIDNYNEIEKYLNDNFKILETRKDTALYFSTLKYKHIFFLKLDNRDYSDEIWDIIKPEYERPFSNNGDF